MHPTPPIIDFAGLGLSTPILNAVKQQGYSNPTPVQIQAIPVILKGLDVRVKAQTGTGKTAAFGLALLQNLIRNREQPKSSTAGNQIDTLILSPTRELAQQTADALIAYASAIRPRVKIQCVHGGISINPQMLALRGGADIVVATPGRLLDLANQNAIKFANLNSLVLDEADRLLHLGFSEELNEILKRLPEKRQNLLFTATFPTELDELIAMLLVKPVHIDCSAPDEVLIQQRVITVTQERKNALLAHLINEGDLQQVLVFANAKNTCNRLVLKLGKADIYAMALHGDKTQAARNLALKKFKQGECRVLIATDLAARGIDIQQLEAVINFDLPRSPNDYIHRIGRTGRAGQTGLAISLLCEEDEAHFRVIEKRMKMRLVREPFDNQTTALSNVHNTTHA